MQTVIVGTAALGMTMIMIAGGIDLSVGSAVALVTVVIAMAAGLHEIPWGVDPAFRRAAWLALAAGSLLGGLCGLFNGGLITGLGVVPFIITLGSLKIFRGLAKWLSGEQHGQHPATTEALVVRARAGRSSPSRAGCSSRRASGSCWS